MTVSLSPFLPNATENFDTVGFDVAGCAAHALRDWQSLAATLDHTLLQPTATAEEVTQLCEEAARYRFACVMVNPYWTALAHSILEGSGVCVGTVVGFPLGASLTRSKREEGDAVLRLGARELDMVMNIGALKSGDNVSVRSDLHAMVELAHNAGAQIKVTLETGLLTLEEKLRASEICVAEEVDFLKTCTGFSQPGATVQDVSLLRGVAGGRCGVKASGGVRTLAAARAMLEAGANRIGTSASVAILQSYIAQSYDGENCTAQNEGVPSL